MSQLLFGVEKYIFGKKVEKVIGQSPLTVNLLICKATSDMLRTIWPFKTKELVMNNCFVIQSAQNFLQNQSISLHFLFLVCHLGKIIGIFEFLKQFPFEKCIHLPGCDAHIKSYNTFCIVSMCECEIENPYSLMPT